MAVLSEFKGKLVGYNEYAKDGVTYSNYIVLIEQKKDSQTGLYSAVELATIREEKQVFSKISYGMPVGFYGEFVKVKDGAFMAYSGIFPLN